MLSKRIIREAFKRVAHSMAQQHIPSSVPLSRVANQVQKGDYIRTQRLFAGEPGTPISKREKDEMNEQLKDAEEQQKTHCSY